MKKIHLRSCLLLTQFILLYVGGITLFVLCGSVFAIEPVREIHPNMYWDSFIVLVWQFQTKASRDHALYESVNLRGFHIDHHYSDSEVEFAKKTSWPFYIDHTAGKGYLHLGRRASDVTGKKTIIVRPNSLVDPTTVRAMKELIQDHVTRAKGAPVVAYAMDDEVSLGSFVSPCEVDGHPNSIAGYRRFLKEMYGEIGKLNEQYGTSSSGFDEIEPQSYEFFRGQLTNRGLGKLNLSRWCDWRTYMDTQFAETLQDLVRYANSLDPDTPAGFVGGQAPSVWGGYDYRKLCQVVQWMEAYDIGATNEILRSFWNQNRPHVQTFFSSKDPKMDAWFLWYYLVHGNRGVIAWPDGWFKEGKVAGYIKANADTFKEIQGPVSRKIIDGLFDHDPIAIYYSHPSIQLTWAMDAAPHGAAWPNRSSSMDDNLSTSHLTRIAWLKTLEDIGIQAKFIHRDHLLAGALEKEKFKVLLLNRSLCLSDAEAAAVQRFAAQGGLVIADHLCGVFDEHGRARERGALDDLFGIKRDLTKGILGGTTLTEVNGEKAYDRLSFKNWDVEGAGFYRGMAVYERGLTSDRPSRPEQDVDGTAVIVGKNNAIYLNLSPIGYLLKRSRKESREWLDLVSGLLKKARVEPRLRISVEGQPALAIEPVFWKNKDRMTLCLIYNLDRIASITDFGLITSDNIEEGKIKIKFTFKRPVTQLVNERTGKVFGDGKEFEDFFTPWEANVYTYVRAANCSDVESANLR